MQQPARVDASRKITFILSGLPSFRFLAFVLLLLIVAKSELRFEWGIGAYHGIFY